MKKTLVALAALAVVGAASAQSSVTLYGVVDANYGVRTVTIKDNGVTVLKNKVTGLTDGGPNGLSTSRWGMRGSEDLGGGMSAKFVLESGLSSDTGASTAGFTRRSLVGVAGGFGQIDLGREYTPAFLLGSMLDVTGSDGYSTVNVGQGISAATLLALDNTLTPAQATALSADMTVGFAVRRDKSINYTSPNFGGVVVKVQAANNTAKSMTVLTGKDRGLGLSAVYSQGPVAAGLALDKQVSLVNKANSIVLGATYDLGAAKLFANFNQTKMNDLAVGSSDFAKSREFNLGVSAPMGAVTLLASVGRNQLKFGDATFSETMKGTDFMLGANYALSKRTTAYFRTGKKDALKLAGDFSIDTKGYHFGVRHTF